MNWLQKTAVLVPTDFSDLSFGALEPAREFVKDISQVHVLHVLPKLHPAEPGMVWKAVSSESRRQHAEAALKTQLQERGYEGVQIQIAIGTPSHEIVDYAKDKGIELIVMPTHGYTGVKRVLIGSVAGQVARLAHCPVLLLH
ncbi:universal stress protein [Lyngbya sp. CCY1209]|jgi:nucleotide-binding universal stress UspA family protein|uniref:universal stress protein n=1 Tax=Lyngbya sp. CCY1209 TaxID=2886103 RepID=UPI002D202281|nr:universal stress protein [Lyngbya sp. CCY1209]MEB3884776.1 universal stress protein [Lyngbya sp. CCY1209]